MADASSSKAPSSVPAVDLPVYTAIIGGWPSTPRKSASWNRRCLAIDPRRRWATFPPQLSVTHEIVHIAPGRFPALPIAYAVTSAVMY
jgi:hypothetical protein